MKKKLESELISIAHRVLKLKNRSETIQLHEETKKLYDQLTVLRFYEENIDIVEKVISLADLEYKLENPVLNTPERIVEIEQEVFVQPEVKEELVQDIVSEFTEKEEQIIFKDAVKQPLSVLFEDVFGGGFLEPDFVKVNDVPVEVAQIAELAFEAVEISKPEVAKDLFEAKEEIVTDKLFFSKIVDVVAEVKEQIIIKKVPEVVFEEAKAMSLNDRLTKGINIGLNDRIAFEKKLFGGSSDDFNRVLSQLNTFDSFEEVKGFINDFIKPDYNNWEGKEEYENRFLGIVEKKFN